MYFVKVLSIDFSFTDKSSHPSEIPLEDIDPVNQSQMHDGNSKVDSFLNS